MHTKDIFRLLMAGCLIMISASVLIAHNAPTTGYELDIYASTPLASWVLLIASFIVPTLIIIHQALTRQYRESRFWLIALFVILLARIVLLYLPFIRGYYTWTGDNITHFGIIKDIINTGVIPGNLFYPVTHTLVTEAILTTGMNDLLVSNFSTALLSVYFVLSTYLLATAILPGRGQQMLATVVIGTTMIGGAYNFLMFANGWSILMMPVLFYFFFNLHRGMLYTIGLLIFLVLFPFFHPLSSLLVITGLVIIELSQVCVSFIMRRKGMLKTVLSIRSAIVPIAIESVILLPWVLSFRVFEANVRMLWLQILDFSGRDIFADIGETFDKVNVEGFEVIVLFVKLYAAETVLIVLSLFTIFLIVKDIYRKQATRETPSLLAFGVVFGSFGFLYLLFLLGVPGLSAIGGPRILTFTTIFTPVLVAFAMDRIAGWKRIRKFAFPALAITIIVPSVLSILHLYPSPYYYRPNAQITREDITGITWHWGNKDRGPGTVVIAGEPERLAHLIYGRNTASRRSDVYHKTPRLPDHFNYNEVEYLGDTFIEDWYLVMTKTSASVYLTVWEDVGRYNENDFERFFQDPTVSRIYTNGEFNSYLITGTAVPE